MTDTEIVLEKAKLAEQAERYDDMAKVGVVFVSVFAMRFANYPTRLFM